MSTVSLKCPNCGGGLKFEPETQKSKCEFCLSEFSNEELASILASLETQAAKSAQAAKAAAKREHPEQPEAEAAEVHLKGYTCNSCGAEVVTEETTSATTCYYCHNPVLLSERLQGDFRPTRIIPFTFDREKAVASFLKWAKSRRFVPREFYSSSQLEKITGVYLPHWMADFKADVDYAGTGTNLKTWRTGTQEFTESKIFQIERRGRVDINHIHQLAMRKIDHSLINSITPYDESKAVAFELPYLSGFFAEKYDIQRKEVQPSIETQARQYTESLVSDSIGRYDKLNLTRSDINLKLANWDYALLPTWILTYLYKGKTYIYAVNGQTGKSYGDLPIDRGRLGIVSGVTAAIVLALTLLGGYFLW